VEKPIQIKNTKLELTSTKNDGFISLPTTYGSYREKINTGMILYIADLKHSSN
jgi:hypothetical protein